MEQNSRQNAKPPDRSQKQQAIQQPEAYAACAFMHYGKRRVLRGQQNQGRGYAFKKQALDESAAHAAGCVIISSNTGLVFWGRGRSDFSLLNDLHLKKGYLRRKTDGSNYNE